MSWWRRNLLALIALVVTIPALVFVLIGFPLIEDEGQQPRFDAVAQGDTVESNGYTFTLTDSQEFVGTGSGADGNEIPSGNSLIAAIIEVEPTDSASTDDSFICDTDLTSRAGGASRRWAQIDNETDFNYAIGDDSTAFCILDGEPLSLEVVFLTPTGIYDDVTIDLTVKSDAFRLALAH